MERQVNCGFSGGICGVSAASYIVKIKNRFGYSQQFKQKEAKNTRKRGGFQKAGNNK